MFERFDETARRALYFARLTAEQGGERGISADHVLAGLLVAAPSTVLRALGKEATVEEIADGLGFDLPRSSDAPGARQLHFDPDVERILYAAESEADSAKSDGIYAEHLLLALCDHPSMRTAAILRAFGFLRQPVEQALAERGKG